jgi:hypothetical protein
MPASAPAGASGLSCPFCSSYLRGGNALQFPIPSHSPTAFSTFWTQGDQGPWDSRGWGRVGRAGLRAFCPIWCLQLSVRGPRETGCGLCEGRVRPHCAAWPIVKAPPKCETGFGLWRISCSSRRKAITGREERRMRWEGFVRFDLW